MTYELALKLKEAGFPGSSEWETAEVHDVGTSMVKGDMSEFSFVPTLEELIEACGERFRGLEAGDWRAEDKSVIWYAKSKSEVIVEGSTPTEAVAKLWLVLNKKDDGARST